MRSGHAALLPLLVALAIVSGGCSAVQRIAQDAGQIRTHATNIQSIAAEIGPQAPDGPVKAGIAEISKEAASIDVLAESVTNQTTRVEDKAGFLEELAGWLLYMAIAVGVILFLWYFGRPLAQLMGWFIPRKKRDEARLAVKMMSNDEPELGPSQYLAAKRAADPTFDRAYRHEQKKQGK